MQHEGWPRERPRGIPRSQWFTPTHNGNSWRASLIWMEALESYLGQSECVCVVSVCGCDRCMDWTHGETVSPHNLPSIALVGTVKSG